jgi:hypothetical protein
MSHREIKGISVNTATEGKGIVSTVSDQHSQATLAAPRQAPPPRPSEAIRAVEPGLPSPSAFREGEETRLRDLLAFAMAAEAGQPVGPGDIASLRQKAEADLQAHAFRTLHNQVEAIRIEAMREGMQRGGRGPGLLRLVIGNLVAIAIAAGLGWLAWRHQADLLTLLNGA